MQNKRHKFIKKALLEKSRRHRWKNIFLCLSFVVVFCTIFTLIHPVNALESNMQENIHNVDNYSNQGDFIYTENEIIDGQEGENQHFETEAYAMNQDGFDLSASENFSNVESIGLLYEDENGSWKIVESDNTDKISPNKLFRFDVNYKDIQIQNLISTYNRTLKYTIPDVFRDTTVDGNIMSGTEKVGSISVVKGVTYVQFNEDYLNRLINEGSTTINGDFYVSTKINLSKLPGDGHLTINAANKSYHFNFENDAIAKYGEVTVDKQCTSPKVISNDTGDYLAYTITVTAGQDGAKDISIVDSFTSNSNLVSFVGITAEEKTITNEENSLNPFETIAEEKNHGSIYKGKVTTDNTIPSASDTSISEPGSLVWKIGEMSAGETRSLTYYVKLKENINLYGKAINNNAKLFSQSYFRQEDNASFTFKIDYKGRMTKRNETPVRQEDKSYRIPYKLNFSISKENSNYSLKDFVFWDYLDYSDYYTDPTVRKYVNYDQDSVKLFVKRDGETEFSEVDSNNYTINWIYGDGGNNPTRFSVKGTEAHPIVVNPGDAYYVSYSLTVSYEAMAAMKSNSIQISNRFIVDASNAKNSGFGTILDRVFNQVTVGNYNWNEKNVGNATTTHQTIMMNGNVYDSSFNSESVESFVVPSGSYPYTVKVNQTLGDWDLTKVIMKDSLTPSDRMQYVGYLKIEACKYDDATNTYNTVDTKWVNIDGKSSFAIKPSDIGWENNKYSYNITYYAKPINQELFSHAIVKNSFTLEGSVTNGISGRPAYPITGIKSEKEVTVNGHYSMSVTKSSWYYEEPIVNSGNWQNGKMYWVVEVSGSSIKEGTVFKDIVLKGDGNNGKNSILHEDSIAGIYKGTLEEGKYISSYKTLNDLEERSTLKSVKDKFDILPLEKNTEINVKAKENIILTTDKLYIVVMSEPSQIPTNYREVYSYKNNIQTSDNGIDFIDRDIATKDLCGGSDILKELGQTFTLKDTIITSNKDGKDQGNSSKIIKEALIGNGNYASWVFKVNLAGDLSGTYRVLEKIPDGMELAYIRIKWTGEKQGTIHAKEIEGLEANWLRKEITAPTDNGRSEKTIYYVNGKQP